MGSSIPFTLGTPAVGGETVGNDVSTGATASAGGIATEALSGASADLLVHAVSVAAEIIKARIRARRNIVDPLGREKKLKLTVEYVASALRPATRTALGILTQGGMVPRKNEAEEPELRERSRGERGRGPAEDFPDERQSAEGRITFEGELDVALIMEEHPQQTEYKEDEHHQSERPDRSATRTDRNDQPAYQADTKRDERKPLPEGLGVFEKEELEGHRGAPDKKDGQQELAYGRFGSIGR